MFIYKNIIKLENYIHIILLREVLWKNSEADFVDNLEMIQAHTS